MLAKHVNENGMNSNYYSYCSQVIFREVFFVSEGHLQNLPLAASYGCMATENPRHTARIYVISINSVHREACYWARSEQ